MLAERRDFTVATYSSTRGTGFSATVWVFTGIGCGDDSLASVLPHPVVVRTAMLNNEVIKIAENLFNLCSPRTPGFAIKMRAPQRKIQFVPTSMKLNVSAWTEESALRQHRSSMKTLWLRRISRTAWRLVDCLLFFPGHVSGPAMAAA